jgi:hypothetical protein
MAAIPSSPAVVFLEKDNSAYPPNIESSIVGIVGFATKGPTNEATLITSQENLLKTFGNPSEVLQGQGLEGALEILETTNQIRYVRAVSSDALEASSFVSFGVCPAIKFAASSFGVDKNLYLKVSVLNSEGTSVLSEQLYSVPSSAANKDAGISQASAIAKIIGVGGSKTDHIGVFFDSNSESTGYLVGSYAGKLARLTVSAFSSTTYTTAGLYQSAFYPVNLSGNLGSVTGTSSVYGGDISTASLSYLTKSLYPGTGYNLSTIANTGQTVGVSVSVASNGGANSLLTVNNEGINSETFNVSLLDGTNFIEDVINIGNTNNISDYIKGELYWNGYTAGTINTSKLANFTKSVTDLGVTSVSVTNNAGATEAACSSLFVKLKDGNYNLSGGTNGTMNGTVAIGSPASKMGIYALDDDLLNISLGVVPGIYDQSVQNALITLAETSQNFLAVVAPAYGLDTVQEATDWMNGRDATYRTGAINSSWAAVFWPHVQVFDVFSGKDRWYDPSIFAIRQMAFTDNVAETWFAPAGFRRGRLTKPTATEVALNQGDRDSLYTNNINPVVNFTPEGITIFGQKTAQRAATSLDRINVRRLMIYLRKVLLQTGRQDLFEPNDAFTWDIVKDKAEALLADIQARRGITDFRVICDSTVNTPTRVDRNELWCKILIKPTKTAEWIIFEVNLTNQSAKFSG